MGIGVCPDAADWNTSFVPQVPRSSSEGVGVGSPLEMEEEEYYKDNGCKSTGHMCCAESFRLSPNPAPVCAGYSSLLYTSLILIPPKPADNFPCCLPAALRSPLSTLHRFLSTLHLLLSSGCDDIDLYRGPWGGGTPPWRWTGRCPSTMRLSSQSRASPLSAACWTPWTGTSL
ncbi:hypothetical protein B484DRAFT_266554 [Ochromonadaceae sp. CCMP2298]|nr:hypothetical protein B484DRAFT_266554 [Ochromonadaceae sp. CCMP2298]